MAEFMAVNAALWVVGKALNPLSGGLVEAWTASSELGRNVDALKMELLYASAMLNNARGRQLDNPGLTELLQKLRDLAYDAEDELDELEYFRIQDELDGTHEAADEHALGCLHGLALNARHTGRSVVSKLKCSSSAAARDDPDGQEDDVATRGCAWPCGCRKKHGVISPPNPSNEHGDEISDGEMKNSSGVLNTMKAIGKHLPCYSVPPEQDDVDVDAGMSSSSKLGRARRLLCGTWPCKEQRDKSASPTPKLKFDRAQISARMKDTIEQLKPVCAKVSTVLELLGSSRSTTPDIANIRPITTEESIEPKLYGRDTQKNGIIHDMIEGKYSENELTVLPIVGPGGIGKTTLTQYIYKEVEDHFEVKVWVCVSLDFNVHRLTEEILKWIPKLGEENDHDTPYKLIEQRLKHKKFLLVLDDMWNFVEEDDWKRLLLPFRKGQKKGSIIIVTTRSLDLAKMVKTSNVSVLLELQGLGAEMFWKLFLAYVFGDEKSKKEHSVLLETGKRIVEKLKGNPLATKTVGRLLRKQLDLDHWTRVLGSKEWELQSSRDDIMPALKLSYDYLPFHLQQCFTYCALFPEDYRFEREELVQLWIGLDVLHSDVQGKRTEDIGEQYLNELVGHGFLKEDKNEDGHPCYVIHDLLHELALKVSSYECLSIYSSRVRSIQIPPTIRHLSIIIDDTAVKDRMTFEDCKNQLSTLDKKLNVKNLHSFMIFGKYHGSFANIFANLLKEAKALRVILLLGTSYSLGELLHNFLKFVHLRYLRIKKGLSSEAILPSSISRLYHLRVLNLEGYWGLSALPRDMSNLVKMRHFLVPYVKLHINISKVGKVKHLQKLKKFKVRTDIDGFTFSQLEQLEEIGGSLHISNLENVQVIEVADEIKLSNKNRFHELTLEWDINRSEKHRTQEELVLENLKPHSNVRTLCIKGHGGTTCPTWLGMNFFTRSLESLCLDDIAWTILPSLGEMLVVDEHGKELQGCITGQCFQNLKRLELVKVATLKAWVGNETCHFVSQLEVLIIKGCFELVELRFSSSTCNQQELANDVNWFPRLRELEIVDCPKLLLLSLPRIPWKRGLCSAKIERVGFGLEQIDYSEKNYPLELTLRIMGNSGQDSMLWKMLAFDNLIDVKKLVMTKCPPLHLGHLQMLTSLKALEIYDSSNVFIAVDGEEHDRYLLPVERVVIQRCGASGKELTQLLSHFLGLKCLRIGGCERITELGVVEHHGQARGEEETAAEGLLLLPPQIQELRMDGCPELSLPSSLDDDAAGGTRGGGLQCLHSLQSLKISSCAKFISSSSGFPFPTSLQELVLAGEEGMATLLPLSSLTSLTRLDIRSCGDLRGEGLWPLLAQGHLIHLVVYQTPKFFEGWEHERPPSNDPSRLQTLCTDDVAGVLVAPTCSLLSPSLTELQFCWSVKVELFTKEQEEALHLLTSLQDLQFWGYDKLQSLPAGLRRLSNLKALRIWGCPAIRSLPKGGLPRSLQKLYICSCPAIQSLPKDSLPSSLQELHIDSCPAILSLPKDSLPSSLRVLHVSSAGNSEELGRQCRKLRGTIPIIYA